jgi:hypothetical protein
MPNEVTRCVRALLLLALFAASRAASAQSLYEMPEGVETRWASGENPSAKKGGGATANGGRKGSPTVGVKSGESRVLRFDSLCPIA